MMNEAVKFLVDYDNPAYNMFYMGFGKREGLQDSRGMRAFRFWNTRYFNEVAEEQGFNFKNCGRVDMFRTIHVGSNPVCPYCHQMVTSHSMAGK